MAVTVSVVLSHSPGPAAVTGIVVITLPSTDPTAATLSCPVQAV